MKIKKLAFVDCWFLSLDEEGKVQYQGQVLKYLGDDQYLVERYSWITGQPNGTNKVPMSDLLKCLWFKDNATFIDAGDSYGEDRPVVFNTGAGDS